MPDQVGRSKGACQVLKEDLLEALGGRPQSALGTIFVIGFRKLLGGKVERFLPGSRAPFSLPTVSGADQRTLQARRIIHLLQSGVPPGAEHAPRLRVFGIGI